MDKKRLDELGMETCPLGVGMGYAPEDIRELEELIELARLGLWAKEHGIPAMRMMVNACTQQGVEVNHEIHGGMMGTELKQLSKVSLLDLMKRALSLLPKE